MKNTRTALAALVTSTALLAGIAASSAPQANAYIVYGPGYQVPEISSPNCKLTPKNPNPVVLIHGTWASAQKWRYLVPHLRAQGMCVWAMNYGYDPDALFYKYQTGKYATNSVEKNIAEIDRYVKKVLKTTGAKKVDIVTHSLGGLLAKIWLYQYKANRYVNNAVLVTPTIHGTDMRGYAKFGPSKYPGVPETISFFLAKPAAYQLWDSPTIAYANTLPDTMPGVHYASLMTKDDLTATPYTTGMLKQGPGATVQNVVVQDVCRLDREVTHSGMLEDPVVRIVIIRALRNQKATCAGTKWAVPAGYKGASHAGEDNGYKGDVDGRTDYITH